MEELNFILKLIESVGPVGATLLIMFFFALSGGIRFLIYFLKKKTKSDTIEAIEKEIKTQFDKLDREITIVNEDQNLLAATMGGIAQALTSIEEKMRNVISERDSKEFIRLALSKCLLLEFVKSGIEYSGKFKNFPAQVIDLKDHMRIELKNSWTDTISKLNDFNFSIKVADSIDEKFFESHISNGVVEKIINITFSENLTIEEKYNRVVNFHNLFIQEVMSFVEEEFKKKGKE